MVKAIFGAYSSTSADSRQKARRSASDAESDPGGEVLFETGKFRKRKRHTPNISPDGGPARVSLASEDTKGDLDIAALGQTSERVDPSILQRRILGFRGDASEHRQAIQVLVNPRLYVEWEEIELTQKSIAKRYFDITTKKRDERRVYESLVDRLGGLKKNVLTLADMETWLVSRQQAGKETSTAYLDDLKTTYIPLRNQDSGRILDEQFEVDTSRERLLQRKSKSSSAIRNLRNEKADFNKKLNQERVQSRILDAIQRYPEEHIWCLAFSILANIRTESVSNITIPRKSILKNQQALIEEYKATNAAKWTASGQALVDCFLTELQRKQDVLAGADLQSRVRHLAQRYGSQPWLFHYLCSLISHETLANTAGEEIDSMIRLLEIHAICRRRALPNCRQTHLDLDRSLFVLVGRLVVKLIRLGHLSDAKACLQCFFLKILTRSAPSANTSSTTSYALGELWYPEIDSAHEIGRTVTHAPDGLDIVSSLYESKEGLSLHDVITKLKQLPTFVAEPYKVEESQAACYHAHEWLRAEADKARSVWKLTPEMTSSPVAEKLLNLVTFSTAMISDESELQEAVMDLLLFLGSPLQDSLTTNNPQCQINHSDGLAAETRPDPYFIDEPRVLDPGIVESWRSTSVGYPSGPLASRAELIGCEEFLRFLGRITTVMSLTTLTKGALLKAVSMIIFNDQKFTRLILSTATETQEHSLWTLYALQLAESRSPTESAKARTIFWAGLRPEGPQQVVSTVLLAYCELTAASHQSRITSILPVPLTRFEGGGISDSTIEILSLPLSLCDTLEDAMAGVNSPPLTRTREWWDRQNDQHCTQDSDVIDPPQCLMQAISAGHQFSKNRDGPEIIGWIPSKYACIKFARILLEIFQVLEVNRFIGCFIGNVELNAFLTLIEEAVRYRSHRPDSERLACWIANLLISCSHQISPRSIIEALRILLSVFPNNPRLTAFMTAFIQKYKTSLAVKTHFSKALDVSSHCRRFIQGNKHGIYHCLWTPIYIGMVIPEIARIITASNPRTSDSELDKFLSFVFHDAYRKQDATTLSVKVQLTNIARSESILFSTLGDRFALDYIENLVTRPSRAFAFDEEVQRPLSQGGIDRRKIALCIMHLAEGGPPEGKDALTALELCTIADEKQIIFQVDIAGLLA